MSFFDAFRRRAKPAATVPLVRAKSIIPTVTRSIWSAADASRLTADWLANNRDANASLVAELRTMRGRSRTMAQNDGYMRRFLALCRRHIVGPQGVRLQMNVTNPDGSRDEFANELIEAAWSDWGRLGNCTMDGRSAWQDVQSLMIASAARDGEVLYRTISGPAADNRFGFRLQLLEADHLAENDNRRIGGDRSVVMGIEINPWQRRLAYHLATSHPGNLSILGGGAGVRPSTYRVPAGEVGHVFIGDRIGQLRGVPWAHASMFRHNMLGGYEEAQVIASRIGASKMGFIISPDGDGFTGDGPADTSDPEGARLMDAAPGSISNLKSGSEFKAWDPQFPQDTFADFSTAMLRGIAAADDVSHHSLSGDYSGGSYSSLRQAAIDERDAWRALQSWFIRQAVDPIFNAWLEWSLISGAIALPFSNLEKYRKPTWRPRGWQWVDPQKDVEAARLAIDAGLRSWSDVLAETGRDAEEVFEQIAADKKLAAKYGLVLNVKATAAPAPAPVKPDDNSDGVSSDEQATDNSDGEDGARRRNSRGSRRR